MATSLHQNHLFCSGPSNVVQRVDSNIQLINLYPVDSVIMVSLIFIHWIEIYPMDSAIQL